MLVMWGAGYIHFLRQVCHNLMMVVCGSGYIHFLKAGVSRFSAGDVGGLIYRVSHLSFPTWFLVFFKNFTTVTFCFVRFLNKAELNDKI